MGAIPSLHWAALAAPPMDDVMTVWSDTQGHRVVANNKGGQYVFLVDAGFGPLGISFAFGQVASPCSVS